MLHKKLTKTDKTFQSQLKIKMLLIASRGYRDFCNHKFFPMEKKNVQGGILKLRFRPNTKQLSDFIRQISLPATFFVARNFNSRSSECAMSRLWS